MPQKVVVIVLLPDYTAIARPDKVYIRKKDLEEICWMCPQGEVEIRFEKESPFISSRFIAPEGGAVLSGAPHLHQDAREKAYKYSIIGRIAGERREFKGDPEVIVQD
jgi:hypothetical protein